MITRNRGIAIIIALIAGTIGGHWLYLGNITKAVFYFATFVLSVLTTLFVIGLLGLFVLWVFVIIDVYNLSMISDNKFNELYNNGEK